MTCPSILRSASEGRPQPEGRRRGGTWLGAAIDDISLALFVLAAFAVVLESILEMVL
jgi:hypothetical protein